MVFVNMLIDAHTHAYEEQELDLIRERTEIVENGMPDNNPHKWVLHHEGSFECLVKEEKAAGIGRFVLLPVSSRPERTRALNRWIAKQAKSNPQVIPFGTLLVNSTSPFGDLEELLNLGLQGIKIHPLLQRLDILSPQAHYLWSILEEVGLPVLLDTIYLKGLRRYKPHLDSMVEMGRAFETGPKRIAALAKAHPRLTLIAAHLGSLYGWDELEHLYSLENVYFDTSYVSSIIPSDQVLEIIQRKGVDHILFGTDAPWRNVKEVRTWFEKLQLTDAERELIGRKNLERLLLDHGRARKTA